MKKVIKWSVIFGIVFSLLGIGVMTAGAMMGGADNLEGYLREYSGFGRHSYVSTERAIVIDENGNSADAFMKSTGDNTANHTGEERKQASYNNIRELEIEAGPGEVSIVTENRDDPQDTSIRIERNYEAGVLNYEYIVRQDHEELKIERAYEFQNIVSHQRSADDMYDDKRMETLTIFVPKDYQFHEVDVEAAAAFVSIEEIHADKLNLELMAGELTMAGGRVGKLDAECLAGDMSIALEGYKEQYDYELSCKAGEIDLGDESYTALWNEKTINYGAGREMDLDCSSGRITVEFYEK